MAYVGTLFEKNFLEYASYVIKDRAIPHIDDGLKPVQRRILHSLFEMDDGKFHKVANVVGHCMKYHPHGDASIYEALVVLANKELFIDTQGNFGNIFTGDVASAARYIECRIRGFAKEVLYKPEVTVWEDSYDGRNREPLVFPAKIPTILMLGAEGIAVGMSTKILPHNPAEVLVALKSCLSGKPFSLVPDFPTGGLMDASDYADGLGKVSIRAKLDTSDSKRIVIRELPFGQTTETLIASIEEAARRGKLKISGIQDYTTDQVEIEIQLARGVYSEETVAALYAFTECETSINVNLLVIGPDNRPVVMTATEVIVYHANRIQVILKAELELELKNLQDKLHARTLERIFIEERIYKRIEEQTTAAAVSKAVLTGFEPFKKEIQRPITDEDIERLLRIPIRRISLYDINKAKKEVAEIEAAIKQTLHHLKNLTAYAISFVDGILARESSRWKRQTVVTSFKKIDVREVAAATLKVSYDAQAGYLGSALTALPPDAPATAKGPRLLFSATEFDKILIIKPDATWSVTRVPEKLFVGPGALSIHKADKDELADLVLTLIFRTPDGETCIKRTRIEAWILDKSYPLLPDGCTLLHYTEAQKATIRLLYVKKQGMRVFEEDFAISDYLVKNHTSQGVRLTTKEVEKIKQLQK